ncbi:unnamed protein product, partial [marine sediment metagenome]
MLSVDLRMFGIRTKNKVKNITISARHKFFLLQ